MAKKEILGNAERGASSKPSSGINFLLDDDEEEAMPKSPDIQKSETKVKEKKNKKETSATNPPTKEGSPKVEVQSQKKAPSTDRRVVEDKKIPFSTIIRQSLDEDLSTTLRSYRQNIDFEYNKAQLIEDAIKKQLSTLKRKIKGEG